MAEDVVAVLDHAEWTEPQSMVMVAMSMGGMIGQHVCQIVPDRLAGVLFLVTSFRYMLPDKTTPSIMALLTESRIERTKSFMKWMFSDQEWLEKFDTRYPEFPNNHDRMISDMFENKETMQAALGQLSAVLAHRLSQKQLEHIRERVPHIVCMTGENDLTLSPLGTEMLAMHLACKSVILPGKGHGIHEESEQEVVSEIRNILKRTIK
ncbi:Alpha/Beta hydrolase protein [Gorgonomyces haynaldii]|nr:Alpha/Beta hydrolase protein [Gorgonomyces haynaldii]